MFGHYFRIQSKNIVFFYFYIEFINKFTCSIVEIKYARKWDSAYTWIQTRVLRVFYYYIYIHSTQSITFLLAIANIFDRMNWKYYLYSQLFESNIKGKLLAHLFEI